MDSSTRKNVRFGVVIGIIVLGLGYLVYAGVMENKSYYYTIKQLRSMDDSIYSKRLRVGGNVQPGSIHLSGTSADFVIVEKQENEPEQLLRVSYKGTQPPPDTFRDNAQALVLGEYGRDGVFHAHEIQAKCASKYAPQQQEQQPAAAPAPQPSKGY